jgi:transcriptional regulator with XRE-family HTH domain
MRGSRPWDDTERGRDAAVASAFGTELRARRTQAGRTQAALAEAAGVSEAAVSLLERGKRQPSLGVAFRLSAALGLEADALARATAARLRDGEDS